jgi:ribosomal protein L19
LHAACARQLKRAVPPSYPCRPSCRIPRYLCHLYYGSKSCQAFENPPAGRTSDFGSCEPRAERKRSVTPTPPTLNALLPLAMFRSFRAAAKSLTRSASTTTNPYPYSNVAILPPKPKASSITPSLRKGKGIMAHLHKTLPTPEKQALISTLFSRRHPDRLLPGSVLTVTLAHAPTSFSGVLLAIRRRGPDTSFVLRNVVQRTGVEMQFFVNSPHLKEIKVIQRAGGGGGKEGRRMRRAKLFYLRDSPDKMSEISAGVRG